MKRQEMVEGLRAEIARLQQVVDLLSDGPKAPEPRRAMGRARKAVEAPVSSEPTASAPGVRRMSAEGKARIAAAQRKRWADQKAGKSAVSRTNGIAPKSAKKASPVKVAKGVGRPVKTGKSSSTPTVAKKAVAKKKVSEPSSAKGTSSKQTRKQAAKAATALASE